MRLKEKHKEIWKEAKPLLAKCRWWDLTHTRMSIGFMHQIMHDEDRGNYEEILMPAIILHDVGWTVIGEEKNTSWGNKDLRIKHMAEGAKIARRILEKVKYDIKLTEKIVNLVATHDDAYLGKPQTTIGEKLIRDADACFVLTGLSFWKDYHVKCVVKGEKMTPQEFLDKKVVGGSKRHTITAQKITDQQIVARRKEIVDTSKTPLQRYKELKASAEKANEEELGK